MGDRAEMDFHLPSARSFQSKQTRTKNMKIISTIALSLLAASLSSAGETNSNDEARTAVSKLKEQPNYSWVSTLEMVDMPFTPEPQHGKTEKDGVSIVTQDFNGETTKAAFKGGKVVVFFDGEWQSVSNPDSDDFMDRAAMTARFLAGSGTAAKQAEELLGMTQTLKAGDDGVLAGDLTEKGVQDLLSFGPRRGNAPGAKNAKGSAKFWLKDGALVKFQSHIQGRIPFGPEQEERDMDITRTVEIKDVGKTKVEVPEEAKKKLDAAATKAEAAEPAKKPESK